MCMSNNYTENMESHFVTDQLTVMMNHRALSWVLRNLVDHQLSFAMNSDSFFQDGTHSFETMSGFDLLLVICLLK